MAKLGNIFNKEEIKKEEQHPRRIIKWIHDSKLKENVEQYCPARDKEEIESLADLIHTEESVTEKVFRFVVRRLRQTQEQEKVLRELLQTRRNKT